MIRTLLVPVVLVSILAGLLRGQEADPAEQIKAKDVAERLRAVSRIAADGHEKAADLLAKACDDKDWEVVERAAAALAKHGDAGSLRPLSRLAVDGPLETIRLAAARSMRDIDRAEACNVLVKALRGKTAVRATEALAEVGHVEGWKTFRKLAADEDPLLRRAAIRGLAATGNEKVEETLAGFLGDRDFSARAAAADGLARRGTDKALAILLDRLSESDVKPVMERRLITAVLRVVGDREGDSRENAVFNCLREFEEGCATAGAAALARLVGRLAAAGFADRDRCASALVAHGTSKGKGAIVTALGRIGGAKALESVAAAARRDDSAAVRVLALRAAVATGEAGAWEVVVDALGKDGDVAVREEAAVLCGRMLEEKTAPALRTALDDKTWEVVLAAAVSLGKLQDAEAIPLLTAKLGHDDHLVRASAAAGLGRIARKDVVAPLITALDDKDTLVSETALDYLQRMTTSRLSRNAKKWSRWWESNGDGFVFVDKVAAARRARKDDEKYDRFRRDPYASFKDVRVIVLSKSRDKMEESLEVLEIAHVLTQTGKVVESGLHPNAVFLANCPGNLTADDAHRLSWFVRSGGHLFATCVALTNTVMRTFPGMLKNAPGRSAGPGPVDSFPVETETDYLRGVFDDHSRPRYQVAGNQLPVAVDSDRVHVLVDSTDACTLWGSGSMASWFSIGHGVVVDSANHFVLQGMGNERLKTSDERRAYALERLGLDFRSIRELDRKGVFKSKSKASKECHDRTMMRLVARFVFTKRRTD